MAALIYTTNACRAGDPDPVALLKGVEAARLSLKSGRLELSIFRRSAGPRAGQGAAHTRIDFQGGGRTFTHNRNMMYVKLEDRDRYNSLKNPQEEAVAAGVAEKRDTVTRSAFDSKDFCNHWEGNKEAHYRDHTHGSAEGVFDPRLLGVDWYLTMSWDITYSLPYRDMKSASVRKVDPAPDDPRWLVTVQNPDGRRIEYTIEDRQPFRVHAVRVVGADGKTKNTVDSTFGPDRTHPLPQTVALQAFDVGGQLRTETRITVESFDPLPEGEPAPGTLASLRLPVGTPVTDLRSDKRLGFWDGTKLSAEKPRSPTPPRAERPAPPTTDEPEPAGMSAAQVALGVMVASLVLAAVAYFVRRRRAAAGGVS